MNESLCITDASAEDMAAVQTIYTHHVLHGIATFEVEPPDLAEMLKRRQAVLDNGLPYLVARLDGRIVGYCYLVQYRPRHAYRFTVESSVYVAENCQGKGIGNALMTEAIVRAERGGWRQMIANVGNSENYGSLKLHEKLGFRTVGTLASVGMKHGRWIDTVLMQRPLGEGDMTLPQ
ncbi:N-acetyltransferase family protein [Edaphovirga cremea]|uniref:GNAT family N-acetyltransferase n=1 Tax=Edaphovirga cremea TaxID=2267246 RepID=UPI0039898181